MRDPAAERDGADGGGSSPQSVLTILDGMRAVGVDIDRVSAAAGFSLARLEAHQEYVQPDQLGRMWRSATELFGRPTLGLHVGAAAPVGASVVDHVLAASATLRDALTQGMRFQRLVTRNASVRFRAIRRRTLLELMPRLPRGVVPPQVLEYALASSVRRVRLLSGRDVLESWVPHAALGPVAEYKATLAGAIRFDAQSTGVVLDDDLLDCPCREGDAQRFRFLRDHAAALLARVPDDASARARVYRVVVDVVGEGEPQVKRIARTLGSSARSLQRQLQAEGTSFRAVVDQARQTLAEQYLADRRLSVAEVAYLLGYAEAAAFTRAFRRWTGRPPARARAR